jgi:putative sigma-54 modulation protein
MKIEVNAVHFSADESLKKFIQKKLSKLETFYDKIISSEVFLKLDKGDKLNTHKKQIEIKLNVPKNSIFVKETADTFEEATDVAMDTLTRKVKQFKQKTNSISRTKTDVLITAEIENKI